MESDVLLEMQGITKTFPGVKALDSASLRVSRGEIHGLVGENGAGKSTIIKVLAGVYQRDSGSVRINGKQPEPLTPASVHDAGVRFIHQELHLVPHFTVAESVFMGQELAGAFGLKRRLMRERAETFLKEALQANIPGNALIRDLGVAERKLVQIARALVDGKASLVVFDEPTAPLDSGESEQVFTAIRQLKSRGISMIYVSHYLAEITALCDSVTVFRNGSTVSVLEQVEANSTDTIIQAMVGRDIDALYPKKSHAVGGAFFSVGGLTDGQRLQPLDLTINRGEIMGVAGLIGSGREEFIDTLYGVRAAHAGSISLAGNVVNIRSPSEAVAAGIVLVPRDRRHDGLVLDMAVSDNINLATLEAVSVAGLEHRRKATERADDIAATLDIRPRNVNAVARYFSGGNQQKVVLARWLITQSRLFILDEPTVGVDIGAKVEIYQLIENLAAEGASVLVSSSDPGELLGLCDRIAVMYRGALVDVLEQDELSMDNLIAMTTAGIPRAAEA